MDRVRRDEHVGAARELSPSTSSTSSEPPSSLRNRSRRNATRSSARNLSTRDAEELRRAVDDHDADWRSKIAQPQAVEQDPGATRVVDQDVAPARSFASCSTVRSRLRYQPWFSTVSYWRPKRRRLPRPSRRPGCARSLRPRERRGARPSIATGRLSRACAAMSCGTSAARSRPQPHGVATPNSPTASCAASIVRARAPVDRRRADAEVELGSRGAGAGRERREDRRRAARRHGHVDPVQRPAEARRERVRDLDHPAHVGRDVPLRLARRDRGRSGTRARRRWHRPADRINRSTIPPSTPRTRPGRRPRACRTRSSCPTGSASWSCGIASRICRARRHAASYARSTDRLVVERDERADRRERRRERHLERQPRGSSPSRLSTPNVGTTTCSLGVTQRARSDVVRRLRPAQAQTRQRPVREGAGGATSNCERELSTGYCQTIQSARGPVSPSGIRRRRSPRSPPDRAEHLLRARRAARCRQDARRAAQTARESPLLRSNVVSPPGI